MIWVVRAGQDALYFDKYLEQQRVFIPWDGYRFDLSTIKTREKYRIVVEKEKETTNRSSVSNWAGQLYSFVEEMNVGDYILIPSKGSHTYTLVEVSGNYCYDEKEIDCLYHSRNIKVLEKDIPRTIFSKSTIYSLGAFRTIFKAKYEEEILNTISKWKKESTK